MEQSVTTQVVLKLPGGKDCGPFSISCTSEVEVLDELPKLFTVAARQPIPGTKFFVDTPQSASHIYVTALSTTGSPLEAMEVYAIEVGQGQRLSEGEVRNRFYDSFGVQLQGAIGVVSDPEAEAGEGGMSPDLPSMAGCHFTCISKCTNCQTFWSFNCPL